MKDLFVLTADSDAQALLRSVLQRHQALQIRPITFDIQRLFSRDPGMVKEGPEIARAMVRKAEYSRLVLIWDHHGSGWHDRPSEQSSAQIQQRLDSSTWSDCSASIAITPELEEWLWHCPTSVARCLESNAADYEMFVARAVQKLNLSKERCYQVKPKELFEEVLYRKRRRRPLPADFAAIGSHANLADWAVSKTFARLIDQLRAWFPPS